MLKNTSQKLSGQVYTLGIGFRSEAGLRDLQIHQIEVVVDNIRRLSFAGCFIIFLAHQERYFDQSSQKQLEHVSSTSITRGDTTY